MSNSMCADGSDSTAKRCAAPSRVWRFFFQAEDGIRDLTVTGVQTCALPISLRGCDRSKRLDARRSAGPRRGGRRSEERRVGEEGRSPRAAYHLKKKRKRNRREFQNRGDAMSSSVSID